MTGRWLAGFIVLAALVVGAHLVPGFSSSSLTAEIRNSVHIIGFAGIAGFLCFVIKDSVPLRAVLILLIIAVLGLLSEFAQSGFENIDFSDVLRDVAGASVILTAAMVWSWSQRVRRGAVMVRGIAVTIGLTVFIPLFYWSTMYGFYVYRFPVILDFERDTDHLVVWPINANISVVDSSVAGEGSNGQVLRVDLLRRNWSGIRIHHPVNDWSEFRYLTFRIAMHGDTRTRFDVRLSDGAHPGYRLQHLIGGDPAGPNFRLARFPLRDATEVPGRPNLDPSNILAVYVIGKDRGPGAVMYLDDFRLE